MNVYAYVEGNPVSLRDPQGLDAAAISFGSGSGSGALLSTLGTAAFTPAALGTVGLLSYWLTDRYINPWLQPIITNACTVDWDEVQKDNDHANYHNTCDRPPPPEFQNCENAICKCAAARWNRRQGQSCFNKRSLWEERWGNKNTHAAHAGQLELVKRRISNAVDDIKKFCEAE